MNLPLEGIRILDLSKTVPGSFCTQILGDYGAEIIKVEDRTGDPIRQLEPRIAGKSVRFHAINRNKKSITLDLRKEAGQEIFKKLVLVSDVIIDGFRPGTMEKWGLDYQVLKHLNHRIIYCAVNAFGTTGPLRTIPAHDINVLSLAGITGLTGSADGPPAMSPIQIAALAGGALYATIAILIALHNRSQIGQGQFCDVSMLDGSISLSAYTLAEWSGWGRLPQRGNELLTGGYAYSNVYETSDNKYVSLGASETKFWTKFCEEIGRPEYIDVHKKPEMQATMIKDIRFIIKQKSQVEWLEILGDICFTPVLNLDEVSEHPQVKEREMIIKLKNFAAADQDIALAGLPIKFSPNPGEIKLTFPDLGQNNIEILGQAGFTAAEIEHFIAEEII